MKFVIVISSKSFDNIVFVVDAMQGQNACLCSERRCEALPLTGLLLTKNDGIARSVSVYR